MPSARLCSRPRGLIVSRDIGHRAAHSPYRASRDYTDYTAYRLERWDCEALQG